MTTSPSHSNPVSVDPGRFRLDREDGSAGTLLGMRCLDCSVRVFGRAVFCQSCTSARLEPVDLSRTGNLYSYTIVRVPPSGWPGPVPYVLGEVELPEGPHVLGEVIGISEAELRIGLEMELAVQSVKADEADRPRAVYKWAPRTETPSGGQEVVS